MKFDSSRRKFIKAGVVLPAAGLVSTCKLNAYAKPQDAVSYRVLGKTGLKVSSVGSGVGIEPDPQIDTGNLHRGRRPEQCFLPRRPE